LDHPFSSKGKGGKSDAAWGREKEKGDPAKKGSRIALPGLTQQKKKNKKKTRVFFFFFFWWVFFFLGVVFRGGFLFFFFFFFFFCFVLFIHQKKTCTSAVQRGEKDSILDLICSASKEADQLRYSRAKKGKERWATWRREGERGMSLDIDLLPAKKGGKEWRKMDVRLYGSQGKGGK